MADRKPIVERAPAIQGTGPTARPYWKIQVLGQTVATCMTAAHIKTEQMEAQIRANLKRRCVKAGLHIDFAGGLGLNVWADEVARKARAYGSPIPAFPRVHDDLYAEIVKVAEAYLAEIEVTA